jgi:hypothetical protein
MPILDAHHDLGHPVETDSAWSESYYFNAYDPLTDTGFFTRVGVRPNEGTMDVGMSLWLPDGELGEYRWVKEQHEMVDTELEVGAVRYSMIEPMKSWRIRMDGEAMARPCRDHTNPGRPVQIHLDVTFSALMPGIGTDGQGTARRSSASADLTASSVGKGHLEQAGRWEGSLSVDGTEYRWTEARGNRDRSWGPRKWGGPSMWRWFSINVGDDVHFGGIRIGTTAGDLHRGWVWDGTEGTSIREWKVQTDLEEDGLTHRVTNLIATDKLGREHELRADLLRVAAVGGMRKGQATTIVNEGLARWSYQGRTGYGISEYLHQLDEKGRPVVAVE